MGLTLSDIELRNRTYARFVALGRAPSAADIAAETDLTVESVLDAWRRLHAAHALVLDERGTAIRMANPFSAVPTAYHVQTGDRWWYANCAWDAFGICAALACDGRIQTACADCGDPLQVDVRNAAPDVTDLLFHCLVPAARWWDDIGFT